MKNKSAATRCINHILPVSIYLGQKLFDLNNFVFISLKETLGAQNYVSHHAWRCNKRAFRSQLRWWIGRHFIFIFVSSMNHVAHLLPAQRREGTAAKMSRLKLWSLGSLGPTKTGCGNWSKEHQNHTICQVTLVSCIDIHVHSFQTKFVSLP